MGVRVRVGLEGWLGSRSRHSRTEGAGRRFESMGGYDEMTNMQTIIGDYM